jgi:hypothetical protein
MPQSYHFIFEKVFYGFHIMVGCFFVQLDSSSICLGEISVYTSEFLLLLFVEGFELWQGYLRERDGSTLLLPVRDISSAHTLRSKERVRLLCCDSGHLSGDMALSGVSDMSVLLQGRMYRI